MLTQHFAWNSKLMSTPRLLTISTMTARQIWIAAGVLSHELRKICEVTMALHRIPPWSSCNMIWPAITCNTIVPNVFSIASRTFWLKYAAAHWAISNWKGTMILNPIHSFCIVTLHDSEQFTINSLFVPYFFRFMNSFSGLYEIPKFIEMKTNVWMHYWSQVYSLLLLRSSTSPQFKFVILIVALCVLGDTSSLWAWYCLA